jgi:hypothetical protein
MLVGVPTAEPLMNRLPERNHLKLPAEGTTATTAFDTALLTIVNESARQADRPGFHFRDAPCPPERKV